MRTAIIDLGTNTFNLLIADLRPEGYSMVLSEKEAVKLGDGAMTEGHIRPEAAERGINALLRYRETMRSLGCDGVLAFATSAVRDCANGADFAQRVLAETGIRVQVISGEEEAGLITDGVRLAVRPLPNPALIMDIGGGSTEFIIADADGVRWLRSYPLGVSRLLQLLRPSDPLLPTDTEAVHTHLGRSLDDLLAQCRAHRPQVLIGSSGSFDSFAEMLWAEDGLPLTSKDVESTPFDPLRLEALNHKLCRMSLSERKQVRGLVEMRTDTIHLASMMVQWVMRHAGIGQVTLSSYALKEGVLHRLMTGGLVPQKL